MSIIDSPKIYPTLDVARLDSVIEFLKANPKVHQQGSWVINAAEDPEYAERVGLKDATVTIPGNGTLCGTGACLAGWTLLLDHEHYKMHDSGLSIILDTGNGLSVTVKNEARFLLGLTYNEANDLFAGGNTIEDIERIAAAIKTGKYRQ